MTTARSRAAGDTHPGLQREQNEDRFFFDEARGIYCVIDGVGGHNAGERAAAIAAEVLRASTARTSEADLRAAFARASDAIYAEASRDPSLAGMACVVSLAAISNGTVRFAHVGDTRLYKLHGGRITKLTKDQSPVGELEDAGALSETEAMRHPRRNEIYKDLGSRPPGPDVVESIQTGEVPFETDAALLLCSDGLTDQVSSGSIRRIVEAFAGSPALAVQELLTAANDAGGKDNVTVVIVENERFPTSVAARGPRRGGIAPAPAPASAPVAPAAVSDTTGALRRAAPATTATATVAPMASASARVRRPPVRAWHAAAWLLAGMIAGAAAPIAARALGYDVERLWSRPSATGPRTWIVGLEPSADFSSIGEALAKAAAGDTVQVGPGEYRESISLKSGVALVGSNDSILRPPVGAPGSWTAIEARNVTGARVAGFVVGAGPGQPLATGLLAEDATVDVDRLEVSGASQAGVDLRAGARVTLRHSLIRDNDGAGVVIRARAEPRLERNVIIHNGHGGRRAGVVVEPGAAPVLVQNGIGGNGGEAVQGWPTGGMAALAQQNVLSPSPIAPPAAAPPPATPARPRPRRAAGRGGGRAGSRARARPERHRRQRRRRGAGVASRRAGGAGTAERAVALADRGSGAAASDGDAGAAAAAPRGAKVIVDSLDGYLHPELLGGGMSRVYRATRRRDGRVIAVKSVGLASEDVVFAERRGAELQRQFHAVETRVPEVLDVRAGAHELFIEMEYIDGEDLSTVLRSQGRFAPNDAVDVAAALADILDKAHQFVAVVDSETYFGIVHGDLKPRNIRMCAPDDACAHDGSGALASRVRVLDFGVAKGIRGGAGETRNVFGSAPYMSPERLIDGHVSTISDVWSLGVVLCELLAGAAPFHGSERDVLRQIDAGPPVLPPDCPADLVAIVHRLLARDVGMRTTSAGEARDALHRWSETTRRTSPLGAVGLADANPTRRTEAGIAHAPTMPVSGARVPLPPIPGVPPLVPEAAAGGETRRTQPQPAVTAGSPLVLPPIPSLPQPVWTTPPPVPVSSGPTAPTGTGPTGPVAPRRRWRVGRYLGAAALWFVLWTTWKIGGEISIWNESDLLGRKVHAAESDALDQMVADYSSLSERSALGFGTWPARQPLREALTLHVDRVILDFRQPEPTVRQNQWKQARAWAAKAMEIGADSSLRARWLLCDAHVKRIDGDAAIARREIDRGNRLLNEADTGFRAAAELTRRNPDAWLGLLRLHSGARSDPEKAQENLNEAERRGWTPGARDYFLIGESARNRADALEKSCDDRRDTDRVKECLTQARDMHKRALEWYDKAAGLPVAARSGAMSQRSVERIDVRLETIDEFSMQGLGMDLLKLAVRHARKSDEPAPDVPPERQPDAPATGRPVPKP